MYSSYPFVARPRSDQTTQISLAPPQISMSPYVKPIQEGDGKENTSTKKIPADDNLNAS